MSTPATPDWSQMKELAAIFVAMQFNDIKRLVNPVRKAAATALLLVATMVPATAAVSDWAGEGNAKVRLIAAGVDGNGRLAAGIEIVLQPGWKTYWRTPGDAGVAPVTDFSASTNIAAPVDIAFPVPHRLDDGYAVTNVYQGHVVLPLSASVVDPAAATALIAALDIGVCAEICVPEHYDLALDLAPGETDAEVETILTDARAKLPGAPEPGTFAVDRVVRSGGTDKRPVFAFDVVAPDIADAEVFVEGPIDWYPAPPTLVSADANRATYNVEFSRLGAKTPIGGNLFTVTVVAAGRAIEQQVTLD
jgi:DsbC/DsbD-like thiol-disulfide interchange protein